MFFFNRTTFLDAPEAWGWMFQDAASPTARAIQDLHHDIFFFILVIMIFVFWMIFRTMWFFRASANPKPSMIVHGMTLEIVWTVVPSIILLIIAYPSFALLYSMDEIVHPAVTLKIVGNQWYWSYEYSDYCTTDEDSITFDSYLIPEDDLEPGQLRLLEVTNRVILPVNTHIRLLITARDVIHCWSVPSLGIKCDGVPGRLNQTSLYIDRQGLFYGQCSEICGAHHGFMPIAVEAVSEKEYLHWIREQIVENGGVLPSLETEEVNVTLPTFETWTTTELLDILSDVHSKIKQAKLKGIILNENAKQFIPVVGKELYNVNAYLDKELN